MLQAAYIIIMPLLSLSILPLRLAVQLDECQFVGASAAAWSAALTVHIGLAIGCLHTMCLGLWFVVPRRLWKSVGFALAIASAMGTFGFVHTFRDHEKMTWMASFLASTFGFNSFFKNMAVSAGSYPEGADKDLTTWILWYASLPEPKFVKGKLAKSTAASTINRLGVFFVKMVALTILLSASPNKQEGIHPVIAIGTSSFALATATVINYYSQLWWLYLMASFCMDFGTLLVLIQGATTVPAFDSPLLQSRSYREAWGERWNTPVHLFLKRSVYKPVRKAGASPLLAAILTFLASGLLHEYNFFCHNYQGYQFGRAILFFSAMGLLMILEDVVPWPIWCQRFAATIPTPVYAILLQAAVVPIFVPFFFRSWVISGMLESFGGLLPHWECRPVAD